MPFDLALNQYIVLKYKGEIAQLWRFDIPIFTENKVTGPLYYTERNGCLKILIGHVWKTNEFRRTPIFLRSLLTLQKSTRTFNFLLISLFFKSSSDISSYYRVALPTIMVICGFENQHA